MLQTLKTTGMKLSVNLLLAIGAVISLGHYLLPRPSRDLVLQLNPPPGPAWFLEQLPRYLDFPQSTFLHVIPSAVFMVLLMLQLSGRIRTHRPALHRINGRLIFGLGILIATSGMVLGVVMPFGGLAETLFVTVLFGLFINALWQGISYARKRNIEMHRKWMFRMTAIALVPVIMRPVLSSMVALGMEGQNAFVPAMVISLLINLFVIERVLRKKNHGVNR